LSRRLRRGHTITVVSPNAHWNWIPSNISFNGPIMRMVIKGDH
jgi:hypothetical protein